MIQLLSGYKEKHGGHWGQDPNYPVSDWQSEIMNDDTRLGYWEWAYEKAYGRSPSPPRTQDQKEAIETLHAGRPVHRKRTANQKP